MLLLLPRNNFASFCSYLKGKDARRQPLRVALAAPAAARLRARHRRADGVSCGGRRHSRPRARLALRHSSSRLRYAHPWAAALTQCSRATCRDRRVADAGGGIRAGVACALATAAAQLL